jgi:signal transduction histidine kinase
MVADTGIGIDASELPHLFERFYRSDKSRNRGTGGAGIGLTIAAAIVAAHGGNLSVESEAGRGSVFRVALPRGEGI